MKLFNLFLIVTIGFALGVHGAMAMEWAPPPPPDEAFGRASPRAPSPASPRTMAQQRVRDVWGAMADLAPIIDGAYNSGCQGNYYGQPITRAPNDAFLKESIKYDAYYGLLLAVRIYCNKLSIPPNDVERVKMTSIRQDLPQLIEALRNAIIAESTANPEIPPRQPAITRFLHSFFDILSQGTLTDPSFTANIFTQRCASIAYIAKHILENHFMVANAEKAIAGHCGKSKESSKEIVATGGVSSTRGEIKINLIEDGGADFALDFLDFKSYKTPLNIELMLRDFSEQIKGMTSKNCIMAHEMETRRVVEKTINEDMLLHFLVLNRLYDVSALLHETGLGVRLSRFRANWGRLIDPLVRGYPDEQLYTLDLESVWLPQKATHEREAGPGVRALTEMLLEDEIQSDPILNFFYSTIVEDVTAAISIGIFIQRRSAFDEMVQYLRIPNLRETALKDAIKTRNVMVQSQSQLEEIDAQEAEARGLLVDCREIIPEYTQKFEQYSKDLGKTELSYDEIKFPNKEAFQARLRAIFNDYARGAFAWFNKILALAQQGQVFVLDEQLALQLHSRLTQTKTPLSPRERSMLKQQLENTTTHMKNFIEIFRERFEHIFDMAKEASALGEDVGTPGEIAGKKYIVAAVYGAKGGDIVGAVQHHLQPWLPVVEESLTNEALAGYTVYQVGYKYRGFVAAHLFVAQYWNQGSKTPELRIPIDESFLQGQSPTPTGTKNWGNLIAGYLAQPEYLKVTGRETNAIADNFTKYKEYAVTAEEREIENRPRYIPPPPSPRPSDIKVPGKLGALQQSIIDLQRNLNLVSQRLQALKRFLIS